jgi:hypothetical protein
MSMSIRVSPVVTGNPTPGGPLPRPDSIAAEVQVLEDRYLVATTPRPPGPVVVSSRDLARKTADAFVATLFDGPGLTPALYDCIEQATQLWALRIGATPDLETPPQPANAETLLMPAVTAVQRSESLLRQEVPNAFKDEDLQLVGRARDQVEGADRILDILGPLLYGLTAMRRQGQQYLDGFCRRVYRRASAEMDGNFLLNRDLNDLRKLVTFDAEKSRETTKLKQDVAADTEAQTLDRVKEALNAQPAAAPPATGPAAFTPPSATPRLPDPLYQKGPRPAPKKRSR